MFNVQEEHKIHGGERKSIFIENINLQPNKLDRITKKKLKKPFEQEPHMANGHQK